MQTCRHEPLDLAIDLGEEVLRTLEADREGASIEETASRMFAGFAGDGADRVEADIEGSGVDGHAMFLLRNG